MVKLRMIVLFVLYLSATIVLAETSPRNILKDGKRLFEKFIEKYKKIYSSAVEKAMRFGIFLRNLEDITRLNARHKYAKFGVNMFTDLTLDEFSKSHMCFKDSIEYLSECRQVFTEDTREVLSIPTELDWRTKNVVAKVKDQLHCGSCWAFSTIGNVESVNAIKTGQLLELSEQQLVDCDIEQNKGCHGGLPNLALQYLMKQGAMSSTSYPYEGADKNCRYDAGKVAVNVTDCLLITGSEDHIAEQLVKIGPLSISIDATLLQYFDKGIIHGDSCKRNKVNHAVLLIGYGVDTESGLKYWLAKNSWGSTTSYFKIERGVNCLNILGNSPVSAVVG